MVLGAEATMVMKKGNALVFMELTPQYRKQHINKE